MSVTIFDKVYVVVRDQSKSMNDIAKLAYVPLGFVVPWDGTKAREKQVQTARNWAGSQAVELGEKLNEPVDGFRISESVRRYCWNGSGNVVWRMVDPRGWEFEITSENMSAILMSCGVLPNGIIPGKCIYGRAGSNNVLLPEGTEHFKEAKNIKDVKKEKKESQVNLKTLKFGDVVKGPNWCGEDVYLGPVILHSLDAKLDGKKYHLFGKFYPEYTNKAYHPGQQVFTIPAHYSFEVIKEPRIDEVLGNKASDHNLDFIVSCLAGAVGAKEVPHDKKCYSWPKEPHKYSHMTDAQWAQEMDTYQKKLDKFEKENAETFINSNKTNSTISLSGRYGGGQSLTAVELIG